MDFETFGHFDSDCPLFPDPVEIDAEIARYFPEFASGFFDLIRCLPGPVDIGSQEQAETRIGDNTMPPRQGDPVGARCGAWACLLRCWHRLRSECHLARTNPTPDILGAAGARSSARHPCCLRHKAFHNECLELVAAARLPLWFRSFKRCRRADGWWARSREPHSGVSNL